jgi:2-dehydropantoate 2-reductase
MHASHALPPTSKRSFSSIVRLLVVGAGAVGGYFGAQLARAGRDVTFLVRPHRAAALRASGLRVTDGDETFVITPQLEVTSAIGATYDAILLAVKAYSLDDAVRDLAPAVGSETMIVPWLNGMRHLDVLVDGFGEHAVLGGVSAIFATLDASGGIVVAAGSQKVIRYGERAGGISPRVAALDAVMRDAGFDAAASADIVGDMWRKWLMLASVGALNALMRGTVGEITEAGGTTTAVRLLDEVAAISTAAGFPPAPEVLAGNRRFLTESGSGATSSMYRDLVAGNRVEADHIVGDLVARGRAFGLDLPLLDAALVNLRVYQNR